ncbi:MAG: sulfatase [Planctomycetota bacterium]
MTDNSKKPKTWARPRALSLILFTLIAVAAVIVFLIPRAQKKPSVLFILVDTLRSDRLGCLGNARGLTPHLDQLASDGVLFDNARSQSSWTLPSMISLMTGKYIFSEIPKLPDETPSLPLLMKQRGYATAGFIANALVGEKEGFKKGFDHFEVRQKDSFPCSGKDLNYRLLPWMREQLKPPFFLYLHYLDPHFPYDPPPEFPRVDDDIDPINPEKLDRFKRWAEEQENYDRLAQDLSEIRHQLNLYDSEVRYVDQCIGEVIEELKRLGLYDDTIVVLASDHGECLWDHPHYPKAIEKTVPEDKRNLTTFFFRDHGYHLFEELIHVPLIIKGPEIPGQRTISSSVANVDLLPTLLDLTGGKAGFLGHGKSLLPVLRHTDEILPEDRALFSHCNEATCIVHPTAHLKLIVPNKLGQYFGLGYLLFHLTEDPAETQNRLKSLEGIGGDVVRSLDKALREKEKHDYFKNMTGEFDEETKEKMRELGYL